MPTILIVYFFYSGNTRKMAAALAQAAEAGGCQARLQKVNETSLDDLAPAVLVAGGRILALGPAALDSGAPRQALARALALPRAPGRPCAPAPGRDLVGPQPGAQPGRGARPGPFPGQTNPPHPC